MNNKKTKLTAILLAIAMLALMAGMLVACNSDAQSQGTRVAVRFDANDGSDIHTESVNPKDITYVPNARVGYDFVGWTLDKQGKEPLDPSKIVLGTTLYAQWKVQTFTVSFIVGEERIKDVTVEYGKSAQAPSEDEINAALPSGKTFAKWDKDFSSVKSNLEVRAQFNGEVVKPTYIVSFYVNGELLHESKAEHGKAATAPSKEQIAGFLPENKVFDGWDKSFDNVTSNLVVNAILKDAISTYNVKFMVKDEIVKELADGKAGDRILLPSESDYEDKIPQGFVFDKWVDQDGNAIKENATFEKDAIFKATFALLAPAAPVISFDKETYTYGENIVASMQKATAPSGITYAYEWFDKDGNKLDSTDNGATCTIKKAVVGEVKLTCKATASASGYEPETVQSSNTSIVTKATLTATINPINIVYGEKMPKLSFTFEGFAFDDDDSVVQYDGMAVECAYQQGMGANSYPVSVSGLTASNYTVVGGGTDGAISSTVTVGKVNLLLKDVGTLEKVYDGTAFATTIEGDSFVGLVVGDVAMLSVETKGNDAKTYDKAQLITALTITNEAGDIVTASYDFECDLSVTIKPATIEFTPHENVTYGYDGKAHTPAKVEVKTQYAQVSYQTSDGANFDEAMPSFTDAGTYTVNYKIERKNYTAANGSFQVVVNKKTATLTVADKNVTYGDIAPEYTANVEGLVEGENLNYTLACGYTVGNNAANYRITATLNSEYPNYDVTINTGTLTVNKRNVNLNVVDCDVVYGEKCPTFTANAIGLFGDDTLDYTIVCDYSVGKPVGTYDVRVKLGKNDNYNVTAQSGTLTVNKIDASLTINPQTVVYGDNAPTFTATATNLVGEDKLEYTLHSQYKVGDGVGGYPISATVPQASETAQNANYNVIVSDATLEVTKKPITITFENKEVTYGDSAPTYTYDKSADFVGNDVPTITPDCNYTQGTKVGALQIKGSIVDNGNYKFEIVPATLTVKARKITIGYEDMNVAYNNGEAARFDVADCTIDNSYGGDVFGGSIQTTSGGIGTYTANGALGDKFVVTALTATDKSGVDVLNCYDVEFDLHVEIKEISIKHTVHNLSNQVYDGSAHEVWVEVEDGTDVAYFVNGTQQSARPSFVDAGEYTVRFKLTRADATPFEGEFNVKIAKKQATVKVGNQNTVFDDEFELEQSAYTLVGVLDKDVAHVTVTLDCSYTKGNNKGAYDINATATHNNYNFTVEKGTLSVSAKAIVLDEKTYTVTYGEPAPQLVGFTSASTTASLDFITLSTTYKVGDFGTYAATATTSNDNYVVDASKINLVVTKRTVTLNFVASTLRSTYGEQVSLNNTESGLLAQDKSGIIVQYQNGDSWSNVPKTLNAGSYSVRITLASGIADRYAISADSVTTDTLTIAKARLNVGIDEKSLSIAFGDKASFVPVYTGFVNGENASVLSGTLVYDCAYLSEKHAGEFDVTMSGLGATNYDIVYATGLKLNVAKAKVTITAQEQNTVYNSAFTLDQSAYTISRTGLSAYALSLVNAGSAISVSLSCNYTVGDNAGAYDIVAKATHNDFDITLVNGTLTVAKANYTKEYVDGELAKLDFSGTYTPHTSLGGSPYKLDGTGFAWKNPDENISCTNNERGYSATFCKDFVNYNVFDGVTIKIQLAKASPNLRLDGSLEYEWNKDGIAFATVIADHVRATNEDLSATELQGAISLAVTHPSEMIGITKFVDGGTYTLTISIKETANYTAQSLQGQILKVKAAKIGTVSYTIEDAVAQNQKTITLFGNAFIANDFTIPSGVTLILPSGDSTADSATTVGNATKSYGAGANKFSTNVLYSLTICNNKTLSINGNILICGLLGQNGAGLSGHTSGAHSQIINNGTISIKQGGNLDVRGYVKGNGKLFVENGATVYSPFVVHDFRGGTNTVTVFKQGGISPFNQYEMPNIQCYQEYKYNSQYIAHVDLYAGSKHNTDRISIIGSQGILRMAGETSRVQKTYTSQKTTLSLIGNFTLGSLELTVQLGGPYTVKMSDVQFPISYLYNINFGDGQTATTVTAPYDYKILPGCNITVCKNATLTTAKSVIFYDSFTDTSFGGSQYPNKSASQFIVNGTYNLNGSFGGNIQSRNVGAKVAVSSTATNLTVSSVEGNSGDTSALLALTGTFYTVFKTVETARFGVGTCAITDETFTTGIWPNKKTHHYKQYSYTGGTAIQKGKTYTFDGANWA